MRPILKKQKSPDELQRHVTDTYLTLRRGIVVIAFLLPLVLWFGGMLFLDLPLKDSMSAYYHSGMRNVFVGVLYATGAFLYLYKGFSDQENYALNCAGILAVCVAMFPTGRPGAEPQTFSVHGASAVLFFAAIAYVCLFRARDTLTPTLMPNRDRAGKYAAGYKWIGGAMITAPASAWLLTVFLGFDGAFIFFIELVGVWVFAAYWLVKSMEIAETSAELLAVNRKLEATPSGAHLRDSGPGAGGQGPGPALPQPPAQPPSLPPGLALE